MSQVLQHVGQSLTRFQQTINYWKIKTVSFNCSGKLLPASRSGLAVVPPSADAAVPSAPSSGTRSAAGTEHQRGFHTYVITCCTTVRS